MSDRKITQYTIVKYYDIGALEDGIRKMFDIGWELYGDPFAAGADNDLFCQALVEYDGL